MYFKQFLLNSNIWITKLNLSGDNSDNSDSKSQETESTKTTRGNGNIILFDTIQETIDRELLAQKKVQYCCFFFLFFCFTVLTVFGLY